MNTLFDDPIPANAKPSDEWYTPKWIFDAMDIHFDLDVCAPKQGPLHTPCDRWYSAQDNGLEQQWQGTVWMNPPYSKPSPWVQKWLTHANGITLVINSKSKWYEQLWNHEKTVVIYPKPPKFILPNGKQMQQKYPVSLWAIGDKCVESLRNSGLGKLR